MKQCATKSAGKPAGKANRFRNRDLPGSDEAVAGSNEAGLLEGGASDGDSSDGDSSGAESAGAESADAESADAEPAEPPRGGARSTATSVKERMRQARREAYQRAKAWRAQDPRQIALKESAKLRRREQYQQVKQRRKEALSSTQAAESARRAQAEAEVRSAFQAGRAKGPPVQRLNALSPDALLAALQPNGETEAEVANDIS